MNSPKTNPARSRAAGVAKMPAPMIVFLEREKEREKRGSRGQQGEKVVCLEGIHTYIIFTAVLGLLVSSAGSPSASLGSSKSSVDWLEPAEVGVLP